MTLAKNQCQTLLPPWKNKKDLPTPFETETSTMNPLRFAFAKRHGVLVADIENQCCESDLSSKTFYHCIN